MPLNVGSVILCQNWPSLLVCAASSANMIRGVCTTTISVSEPVSRCGALDYTAHASSVNAPRHRLRCGRLQAGVQTVYAPGFQPGPAPVEAPDLQFTWRNQAAFHTQRHVSTARIIPCSASLLDDLHGRWSHRRLGIAVLVGRRRHRPYRDGLLVDRLPQRLVLRQLAQQKTLTRWNSLMCSQWHINFRPFLLFIAHEKRTPPRSKAESLRPP